MPTVATSDAAERLARYAQRLAALRKAAPLIPLRRIVLHDAIAFGSHGFSWRRHRTRHAAGVTRGAVSTLYRVAAELSARDENPLAPLGAATRAHMLEHLVPFLAYQSQARRKGSSLALRSRAAGFALLLRLAEAMADDSERPWRSALLDWLLAVPGVEPHRGLRLQMALGIDGLPAALLSARQQREAQAVAELVRPSAPPYAEWFGHGRRRLSVVQYVQDEFWSEELAHYRENGFAVTQSRPGRALAFKQMPALTQMQKRPAGENEAEVTGDGAAAASQDGIEVQVVLRMSDKDVLLPMRDPRVNIVLYTGHANVGGVALNALATAPEPAPGTKLIGFLACRTKQSLPGLQRRYPGMHFLVSDHATYGHDDRTVIQQFFVGVATRASYANIARDIETHDLIQINNYLFPSQLRMLAHSDYDADGVIDLSGGRRDVLYSVPSRKQGKRRSISFKPKRRALRSSGALASGSHASDVGVIDPSAIDGGPVADAVQWFNSVYCYHVDDFGSEAERARADRFVADGWFASQDRQERLRIVEVNAPQSEPLWRISVNAAYHHQSPHAVAMLVSFEAARQIYMQLRPDEGNHQRRMRALAMAVSYAVNLVPFSDEADDLLRTFAKAFGFPPTLDYQVAHRAIMSDYEHEASAEIIRQLERGMQYPFLEVNDNRSSAAFRRYVQAALDKLRDSPSAIGQATFELIVTGRVKVDELRDVTAADYRRIRRELLKGGVELAEDGFMALHDHQNGTLRAITQHIEGYMWDDRIYISRGHSADALAATLVHEVNHVLNRSEEHYRSDKAVLREEYRAALAEHMLHGLTLSSAEYTALKQQVIELYGLNGVTPEDVADIPEGRYLPTDP